MKIGRGERGRSYSSSAYIYVSAIEFKRKSGEKGYITSTSQTTFIYISNREKMKMFDVNYCTKIYLKSDQFK